MVLASVVMFVAVVRAGSKEGRIQGPVGANDPGKGKEECKGIEELTPAQQYAGEVLSYLLDKNVYLSMHFTGETDLYSNVDRIYLDIMDIEYANIEEETDQISRFIFSKLEGDLDRLLQI